MGLSVTAGGLAVYVPLRGLAPLVSFFSMGLFFAALILVDAAEQFELDLPNKRFRHFHTFFGLTFGQWKPLPVVNHVVIKRFSENTIADSRSWQVNTPRVSYIVILSTQQPAIIAGKFSENQAGEAQILAGEVAAYLGVDALVFE